MGRITFIARDAVSNYAETLRLLEENDPEVQQAIRQEIVGYDQQIGTYLQQVDADPDARIHGQVVAFQKAYIRYRQFRDQVLSTYESGDMTAAAQAAVGQL